MKKFIPFILAPLLLFGAPTQPITNGVVPSGGSLTVQSGGSLIASSGSTVTLNNVNGNTITAGSFTLTGSAAKTLAFTDNVTFGSDGTGTRTLNIGAGGTLGTAAFTAASTYQTAITFGTGVQTALGVNIGSAGAPVLFNGAGGTPSSIVLTNATGTAASLTAGTASAVAVGGISGLGTGVATALAINVGSAGAPVVLNGALGTPASGSLGSCAGYLSSNLSGVVPGANLEHTISFVISGGGSAITTGVKDLILNAKYGGTLTGWSITTSPADTMTVDILRSADGGAAPSSSIVGGGTKPAIASGVNVHSTTFTSWTSTTVSAFDNFKVQVTAIGGTATAATITLYYQ